MFRFMRSLIVTAVVFAMVSTVRAELVDSPQYQSWAKFKPGSSVNYLTQMSTGGMNMKQTMTYTLKAVTPEKATVEIVAKMEMSGMTRDMPPQTVEFPAKVEKGQEYSPPGFKGTVKETEKATIDLGGKKYECRVMAFDGETDSAAGGGKATGKIWRCEDVPGGLLMTNIDGTRGPNTVNIAMTMQSIDVK